MRTVKAASALGRAAGASTREVRTEEAKEDAQTDEAPGAQM